MVEEMKEMAASEGKAGMGHVTARIQAQSGTLTGGS